MINRFKIGMVILLISGIFLSGCSGSQGGTDNSIPAENTYSVSGKVMDTQGDPVPGVSLIVSGEQIETFTITPELSSGRWTASGLKGDLTIQPEAVLWSFSPENQVITAEDASRSDIDFIGTMEDVNIMILTQPANTSYSQVIPGLTGSFPTVLVTDTDNNPVANFAVGVSTDKGVDFASGTVVQQTDEQGIASFTDLVLYEGEYRLVFSIDQCTTDLFTVACGGSGSSGDPYLIHNLYGLDQIRNDLTAAYRLEADIDAAVTGIANSPYYNNGEGWDPMGRETPFSGLLEGNNFTISNLVINRPLSGGHGLFCSIDGGTVKNLYLNSVTVSGGTSRIGGLTGSFKNGLIQSCYVINAELSGERMVGGLIGSQEGGLVEDCHGENIVISPGGYDNTFCGGLVGWVGNPGTSCTIRKSSATGSITGDDYLGGLTGNLSYNSVVRQSHADVTITGNSVDSSRIGGLIGTSNEAVISDCYTRGDLFGYSAAGLIGTCHDVTITNCYSAAVLDASVRKGLVNPTSSYGPPYNVSVNSCYYDQEKALATDTGNGEPKTTEELTNPDQYYLEVYLGWNPDIWTWDGITNDGYPYLVWED